MNRKTKSIIGYILGTLALAIPYISTIIIFHGEINYWIIIAIASVVQVMYLISVSMMTFDLEVKNRFLKSELKEYEEIISSERYMLKFLVKNTRPKPAFAKDDMFLMKYGSGYGNLGEYWKWNENIDSCSEEELLAIYIICKKSWK